MRTSCWIRRRLMARGAEQAWTLLTLESLRALQQEASAVQTLSSEPLARSASLS